MLDSAETDITRLARRAAEANALLMQGDARRSSALMHYTDDFLLMSPFGGTPSRGSEYTAERIAAMGRFFRNGTFSQELVQGWATAEMVTLALIERAHVEVGGLPAQDWALRVTLVFRREAGDWRLVHRHADPLVAGIDLEQAAALGRGAPQSVLAPQSVFANATS